ncbi:MAG: DUF6198 family protein [Evtepia gabavorous]
MKPTRQETVRRYGLLGLGLLITAFGIAFSIQAGLGTSPISSLPYVVSLLTPLSVGTATICLHGVLILLQLLILRRRYDPVQLLRLPVALVFGYLTDLGGLGDPGHPGALLWGAVAAVPGGVFLVGVGVALEVVAGVVTLAGEGFVLAVCRVTPFPFGNLKVAFDVLLVGVASLLSPAVPAQAVRGPGGYPGRRPGVGLIAKRLQPPCRPGLPNGCRSPGGQQAGGPLPQLGEGQEGGRGEGMGPQEFFHPDHVVPPAELIAALMKTALPGYNPGAGGSGGWPG